jgi:hypothetical protein
MGWMECIQERKGLICRSWTTRRNLLQASHGFSPPSSCWVRPCLPRYALLGFTATSTILGASNCCLLHVPDQAPAGGACCIWPIIHLPVVLAVTSLAFAGDMFGLGTLTLPADFARLGWLLGGGIIALCAAGTLYSGRLFTLLALQVMSVLFCLPSMQDCRIWPHRASTDLIWPICRPTGVARRPVWLCAHLLSVGLPATESCKVFPK